MVSIVSPLKEMLPDASADRKVPEDETFRVKPGNFSWKWDDMVQGLPVPVRVTSADTGYVTPVRSLVRVPDTSNEADPSVPLPFGSDTAFTVRVPNPKSK